MTLDPRLTAAAITYAFRARRPGEGEDAYREALLEHVFFRDWTAAHELRVGRPAAEWTAADKQDLARRIEALPPHRDIPTSAVETFDGGIHPVTAAALLDLADRGLDIYQTQRQQEPIAELAIMASVLLTTGQLLVTTPSRGDRVATLKLLARRHPVFGFFIISDAFITSMSSSDIGAEKWDVLLAHVGTRDLRMMKQRRYRLVDGQAVFQAPEERDMRQPASDISFRDPYAEIFVSVPPATGPTS